VAIPIILYNVPTRTACDMLPETVARLAHISNIVGIKDATGQMTRLQQILRLSEGCIDVFSGDDPTAASWMQAGAKGNISAVANIVPKLMAKLCDAALDGAHGECLQLNEQLIPLYELLFVETNPIAIKWAASKMGLIENELRLPLTCLSKEYQDPLEKVLKHLELI
jgi:4-hydroxy-tetrahydrodipicolinate synthase